MDSMRKIYLLLLSALLCAGIHAAPRSLHQARALAPGMRHAHTALQPNGEPAFYVFNRGENQGFVIISADDRTYTVLGYSDHGQWDENDLPDATRAWLEGYAQQISALEGDAAYMPEVEPTYTPVAPMCTTQWGQRDPYNLLCPMYGEDRTVTGCVATAAAQVMKYHNYPTHGIGSHSYKWANENGDSITLSANFAGTTYQWSKMLDTYDEQSTAEQENAVATLMSHCGIASNMIYGTGGSSANSSEMVRKLITNFGYDKGIRSLMKDYAGEQVLMDAIYADLRAGRPVYINARTLANTGHAFVCDGIDAEGMLHINWGWYGKSDGFYRLSALAPKEQGTGGSTTNSAYTQEVQAFTNIRPDAGGEYVYSFTCENVYTSKLAYHRDSTVRFTVDTITNRGMCPWTGNLRLCVYSGENLYQIRNINSNANALNPGWYRFHMSYGAKFADYPAGEYEVEVCARASDQPDAYIPVYRKWLGVWRCKMTVTQDSVFITPPSVDVPEQEEPNNPTGYTFSDLRAYYYPSASSDQIHKWKLQLGTEHFYTQDGENQFLLLMVVEGGFPNAIVGSYPMKSAGFDFQCLQGTQYDGNAQTYAATNFNNPECAIVYQSETGNYLFHYSIQLGKKIYSGQAEIEPSKVRAFYGEAYGTHKKNDPITLDHSSYSALTTSPVVSYLSQQGTNWESNIPYVVEGTISSLVNTPAEIAYYKNCRLYISDGAQPLYCYNTKWLNNTAFTTGAEIQQGGKAVIAGPVKNYAGTTPEINSGYFCQYKAPVGEGTEQVSETRPAQKILRDGVLYIRRDGVDYTVQGLRLND